MIGTIPIQESTPVWVAFSADNKYAYFTGAVTSRVFKYDRKANKIVGVARAGVEGPYGAHSAGTIKIFTSSARAKNPITGARSSASSIPR